MKTNHESTQEFSGWTQERLVELCDSELVSWTEKAVAAREYLAQHFGYGDQMAWRMRFYDRVCRSIFLQRHRALRLFFAALSAANGADQPDRLFSKVYSEEAKKIKLLPFVPGDR